MVSDVLIRSPLLSRLRTSPTRAFLFTILFVLLIYWHIAYLTAEGELPRLERPPKYASPETVALIKENIAFVIVTSGVTLGERFEFLMKSWVKDWKENTYWLSDDDVSKHPQIVRDTQLAKNWVNSGCDNSYSTGLVCKNKKLVQMFMSSQLAHYKWVFRLMDDTFVHPENAWDFLSTLNASEPALIGERFCHPEFEFPTGGPGLAVSRGLIDTFDKNVWNDIAGHVTVKEGVFDDLVWGQYLKRQNIPLTHHNGFSQVPASHANPLFNYIMARQKWNLDFRPIAYHQGPNKLIYMPQIQDTLHRLPYDELDEHMLKVLPCKCWPLKSDDHELRCSVSQGTASMRYCGGGLRFVNCLTGL